MFSNWKTSLVGILAGTSTVLASGAHGWQQYLQAALVTAIGLFAHDAGNPTN
jgi:hypothetical protein